MRGQVLFLYLFSAPVFLDTALRLHHVWFGDGGDLRYLANPAWTTIHLLPGLLMFALGPLQFTPAKGAWHRVRGRLFAGSAVACAFGIAILAFALPAIGGLFTQVSTLCVVTAMVAALGWGIVAIRRGDMALHRRMMIRGYGLSLTVASARWIIYAGFAFGYTLEESFLVASIVGSALTILAVEWLLLRETGGGRRKTVDAGL